MKKFYFLIIPALALLLTACAQGIRSLPGGIEGNVGTSSLDARNLTDSRIGLGVATIIDSTATNPERFGTVGLGALEIWLRNSALPGQEKRVWTRNDSHDGSTTAQLMGGGSGASNAAVQIPGAIYRNGEYYLTEDTYFLVPLAAEDAERAYTSADTKKIILKHINKKLGG